MFLSPAHLAQLETVADPVQRTVGRRGAPASTECPISSPGYLLSKLGFKNHRI